MSQEWREVPIIAILAAILFPVFAKAREKARQSSCSSNFKQVALAQLQYIQDYDERTVRWAGYWDPGEYNPPQVDYWYAYVNPYMKNAQVLICPSAPDQALDPGNAPANTYLCTMAVSNGFPQQKLSAFDTSANTVMMCETQNANYYRYRLSTNTPPNDTDAPIDGTAIKLHNEGSNFAFVDGHVKWISQAFFGSREPTADVHWWPNWPY